MIEHCEYLYLYNLFMFFTKHQTLLLPAVPTWLSQPPDVAWPSSSYLYNSKLFKNFEGIWILIEPLYMIWSRSSIIHICDDLCYYTCLLLAQTSGLLPIRQILCKISNIWDDLDLVIMPGSLIRISDLACRWSTA